MGLGGLGSSCGSLQAPCPQGFFSISVYGCQWGSSGERERGRNRHMLGSYRRWAVVVRNRHSSVFAGGFLFSL